MTGLYQIHQIVETYRTICYNAKANMAQTEQAPSITRSSEFVARLISPEDGVRKPFVGGIVYDNKKKIVGIGVDSTSVQDKTYEERLFSKYGEIPSDGNIDGLVGFSSRLLPLPDFSQIYVAQVGLGGIAVKGFDSLRTHPSVSVNIRYADPQNPELHVSPFLPVLQVAPSLAKLSSVSFEFVLKSYFAYPELGKESYGDAPVRLHVAAYCPGLGPKNWRG